MVQPCWFRDDLAGRSRYVDIPEYTTSAARQIWRHCICRCTGQTGPLTLYTVFLVVICIVCRRFCRRGRHFLRSLSSLSSWSSSSSFVVVVRALNVRKGHTFSHLDKSMKFGTDDLHTILFQNFDGSNLRF